MFFIYLLNSCSNHLLKISVVIKPESFEASTTLSGVMPKFINSSVNVLRFVIISGFK